VSLTFAARKSIERSSIVEKVSRIFRFSFGGKCQFSRNLLQPLAKGFNVV
jgi:hypothetical protein